MSWVLWLMAFYAWASEVDKAVIEKVEQGHIDWTQLKLQITFRSDRTVGAWKDRKMQEQDVVEQLGPAIQENAEQVHITPNSTAADLIANADSPALSLRLTEGLKGWNIEESRYHSSGGVEMDASLDLLTWLRPVLVSLAAGENHPQEDQEDGDATGLVIDIRGHTFRPCIAPTVEGEEGGILVDATLLTPEVAQTGSPVLYVTDPTDPRAQKRAGEKPIFVLAASTRGGHIILAPSTYAQLQAAPGTAKLAAHGQVVIVVDP
jgi:hypothetical protein